MEAEEIKNRFMYHKGTDVTIPKHVDVRQIFSEAAGKLNEIVPEGRAKAVMFTELENASMWANKAVAELAPVVLE